MKRSICLIAAMAAPSMAFAAHWTQVKTQLHEGACVSDTPCVILLLNKTPYVTEYPEAAQ
jgi:hypothetical protein